MNAVAIPLRIHSPAEIFLAAAFGYLLLWITAPIDFVFQGGSKPVVMLFLYALLFVAGVTAGFRRWRSGVAEVHFDITRLRRFTKLVAVLGTSGMAMRLFDRIVLRAGGRVTTDFMLNRDLMVGGGSGVLSFPGSLFGPMLMLLPFFVMLLRAGGERKPIQILYIGLSLAYPLFDLLLIGSRSTLVIYLGLLLAATLTTRALRPRAKWLVAGVGALSLIWLAGSIFWTRTEQMGIDPVQSMLTSGYSQFAPAKDAVLSQLRRTGNSGIGSFLFAYVHLCQYLLHGVYEFLYAAANVSSPSTNGLQTFYIPLKIVGTVVGTTDIEEVIDSGLLRPGVFTTLFGPLLYDFGPVGAAVASLLFGMGAGNMARAIRKGRVALLPLYLMIIGFLPFAFVVNLFTSGTGQFLLLGALLLMAILKLPRYRIQVDMHSK